MKKQGGWKINIPSKAKEKQILNQQYISGYLQNSKQLLVSTIWWGENQIT